MENNIKERISRMIQAAPDDVKDASEGVLFYTKKKKKPKLIRFELKPKNPLDEK